MLKITLQLKQPRQIQKVCFAGIKISGSFIARKKTLDSSF